MIRFFSDNFIEEIRIKITEITGNPMITTQETLKLVGNMKAIQFKYDEKNIISHSKSEIYNAGECVWKRSGPYPILMSNENGDLSIVTGMNSIGYSYVNDCEVTVNVIDPHHDITQ